MPFPAPPRYVEATRREPCHGLDDLPIDWLTVADSHWQSGAVREPWGCYVGTNEAPEPCPVPQAVEKILGERGVPVDEMFPFTLYSDYNCGVGGRTLAEARQRAEHRLLVSEHVGVTSHLMSNELQGAEDITPTPGTAVPMLGGLSLLVSYAALNMGTCPTFHSPVSLLPYLMEGGQVWRDDVGRKRSPGMGFWMFGAGYEANLGPDGTQAPAGEAWLYASGVVSGFRSDVLVTPDPDQNPDHEVNNVTFLAERTYALGFECPPVAVLVKVSCCC